MNTILVFLGGLAFFLLVWTGARALVGMDEIWLVAGWQAPAFYFGFRLAKVVWT